MGEEPTRYLSTPQAAALLGLSHRTLERYRVTGGGPPFLRYCTLYVMICYGQPALHPFLPSSGLAGGRGSRQDRGRLWRRRAAAPSAAVYL